MTADEIEKCFAEMKYERDIRKPPNNHRRGQFQKGWKDAATRKEYTAATLRVLTWRNLGYRFGKCFSPVDESDYVYGLMAAKYKRGVA